MATEKIKLINKFYGGITRDEKSTIPGSALNVEELDIFTNRNYVQAEQIFSSDTLPASSEVYAYTSSADGTAYAYGKETAGNKVRIFSVASGGGTNPGAWATLFTSADTTNLAYSVSPVQFFRTTESPSDYLYYCAKTAGNSVVLRRYSITGASDSAVGTLSQLNGSYDRISFRVAFGELYITNGKYISKVDEDGTFTEDAFTLPNEWIAVDLCAVSDVAIILARYLDRTVNFSKGFWWDLTSTIQVDDSFDIPSGGPQWIQNHKETIKMCCAINGTARFFQLSGAFPGAIPLELPGLVLSNVASDDTTQPVSATKTVATKDKILYFGLTKTDKSGVYAMGQLDSDTPVALILTKRFATSDYSLHKPTALMIQGSNFYGAFIDNGTASTVRCESLNSPDRSTQGIYESVWIDDDDPISDKVVSDIYISVQPMPASTDVDVSVAKDFGSFTEIFRPDGTSLNTTSAVLGNFKAKAYSNIKSVRVRAKLVSSGSSSPKLTSIGIKMVTQDKPAAK